jgi:hypothetical protein
MRIAPVKIAVTVMGSALPLLVWGGTIETETVRLRPAGGYLLEGVEYQSNGGDRQTEIPLEFEYGVSRRLELMIEPVAYSSIHSASAGSASGFGDTEVTLLGQLADEDGWLPALALAGEVKLPTARNTLIGSGKTDYAAVAVASHKWGSIDLHFNLGYTVYGRPAGPAGAQIQNRANAALAAVYPVGDYVWYGELLTNNLLGEGGSEGAAAAPATREVGVGESSATVGVARRFSKQLKVSFGLSYDNNGAVLFRPGIEYRFP